MKKLSIVIPTYTINEELEEMAVVCVLSYRPQVDEIIITEDGGKYSDELRSVADIYIHNSRNEGYTINVNRGWKLASGDYVAIINSDTFLLEGNMRDLCVKDKVTCPDIPSMVVEVMAGCFYCVPKTLTKKYGYLMEEMTMYASDSEYEHRLEGHHLKVPSVRVMHHMNRTTTAAGVNVDEIHKRDDLIYQRLIKEGKTK